MYGLCPSGGRGVKAGGHVIVSTFGPEGPTKCRGLDVVQDLPPWLRIALNPDIDLRYLSVQTAVDTCIERVSFCPARLASGGCGTNRKLFVPLEDELEQRDYIAPRLSEASRIGNVRYGACVKKSTRFSRGCCTATVRIALAGLRLADRRKSG